MLRQAARKVKPFRTTRILALGFAAIILTGTMLLSLPISATSGRSVGVDDALFTATSAVCVTGLVVRDTGTEYTRFGQTVIILLIQVGGLGFMAFGTLLMMLLGRKISLKERLLIREAMNEDRLSGMVRLMRWVAVMTLCIEMTGAAILSTRFVPIYGWGDGLYYSMFHSISAFCNAGFDLIGGYRSMVPFDNDPVMLLTISSLIVLGGLGFAVCMDVFYNRRFSRLEVDTRLTLVAVGALILVGTLGVLAMEWSNPATLGPMPPVQKALNALFQSVTLRTAGFNSFDQASMRQATKLLSIIWMFIGAAPASTGGGIKVTTFSVLMLMVISIMRGRTETVLFGRTLPRSMVQRAMVLFLIALSLVLFGSMVLSMTEVGHVFIDLAFEVASAFGTVGVTCGVTGGLSPLGRAVIILLMYIGRVGPLSLAMSIASRQAREKAPVHYPDARIMIG